MRNKALKLFIVSFVMLFLEIFLIRWVSTEIRIFAYLNNLVLLACFLGIGIGCYFSGKEANVSISIAMLALLALTTQLGAFKNITDSLSGFSDSVIWEQTLMANNLMPALKGMLLTFLIFAMILMTFVPLGQILGRILNEYGNIILGYSINIGAGLFGIWFFNLCSFFYTPPWVWFMISLALLLFFMKWTKPNRIIAVSCSILILFFSTMSSWHRYSISTVWTPYQKLDIYHNVENNIENGFVITVNNTAYMCLLNLSYEFFKGVLGENADLRGTVYNQYVLPFRFTDNKEDVLLVGAGAGNDAAGALRSGAAHIDAVEIDPGIYRTGLLMHPEQPYASDRVNIFIDDTRAFFKKSVKDSRKYDIICFGLLDSHTLQSNYNNLRLDHYVYTRESFEEVRKLLKDDGVLSVIFQPSTRWIGNRIYGLLKDVFGDVPYIFEVRSPYGMYGWGGVMFITGNNLSKLKDKVESDKALAGYLSRRNMEGVYSPYKTKLTTDDWPYLYVEKPAIPRLYLLIIVPILLLLFIISRFLKATPGKVNMHFFFLGCAFLLLEFQNVSKSALLFGSTWIANSFIISAILILILLANLFVYRFRIKSYRIFYFFLLVSIAIVYLVPLEAFNIFTYWPKAVLAAAFINIPIFFAGVIFITSFKKTAYKDAALGSNLIGAAAGGLLETLSFIFGIKALLILVFLFYAVSSLYVKDVISN